MSCSPFILILCTYYFFRRATFFLKKCARVFKVESSILS
ncbi:hypothetical protein CAMGR0001_2090 [Campylobacter gracilis RM3268]|uniref:Uncharacterized protein n=1 Tax=Campylobacter gracilis RM3268 TaxID=553220 RepID=C8PLS9_9BACT|nr:hypothetical protein CAMGR0001_2090 [Campylobacter gracilis RM3268]